MRAGDILLLQPGDWIGRMISRATSSPWAHVALAVSEQACVEVSPPGVRVVRAEAYAGRSSAIVRPRLGEYVADARWGRLAAHRGLLWCGRPYSHLKLIALAGTPRWARLLGNLSDGAVCSSVVARAWSESGLIWRDPYGRRLNPDREVRPDTIASQAHREAWLVVKGAL